ncbi:MAG: DUF1549 domain-containing protein [Planctomycetaceae bacterium]|jgi:hypothetical protein|nr:DUF1549 domain-containing protein [Planctomycetaceae bacterium]MBT6156143.1 DUF1549 domain-containing protein [Planctomycetaceae bacterium]MBT6486381.1 DUF1549 domain-containing protein [Planctomycetaceae bacterium]MBT6493522.1 DUF1549 domain-containing protein [Planctomycetaceae bacterium]
MAKRHSPQLLGLAIAFSLLSANLCGAEIKEAPITVADREHWSFRPLLRPAVPTVKNNELPRNAIDHFILARLEAAGLTPLPEAGRTTLIRRVTYDLTGLPPSIEEVDTFLADRAPGAYERIVDRLLASDAYGERWAQHWLDLARFAETDGFEHDHVRPNAWRYRDWVIDALNADMPYDEFVRRQLAGDEIDSDNSAARIATGFLLCGPDMPDINLQQERRHSFLNDMTATVGSAFLGLQFGCAQCHDHKYDPISQADFYRLRAFFDAEFFFQKNKIARMTDELSAADSRLMIRGDFRRPGAVLLAAFPRIANPDSQQVDAGVLKPNTAGRRTALANWITRPDNPLTARVIVNRLWQHHFGKGLSSTSSDFGVVGDPPTHPELLDWLATEFVRTPGSNTISTAAGSGATGGAWSLKRMHRLMVTSSTYRQASRFADADWTEQQTTGAVALWTTCRKADPENSLHWRRTRQRLEGESIRDAMLTAADTLSRRRGGSGIRPPLPKELLSTLLKNQWPVTPDRVDHDRRSIYLFVRRNLRYPLFDVFDRPDANLSCARRNRSTIAPQALTQLNSAFSFSTSKKFARELLIKAGDGTGRQVDLAYRQALGRTPTVDEHSVAAEFISSAKKRLQDSPPNLLKLAVPENLPESTDRYHAAALTQFCLAMFNLNEFLYID